MAVAKSVGLEHAFTRKQGNWSGKARIHLSERDIFLVVSLKYSESPLPLPQKEVIRRLRQVLPYRDCSEKQLRRLLERALNDPRCNHFLEVKLMPPIDWDTGKVLRNLLGGVREVIVIPSITSFAPEAAFRFLGLATASVFGHRLIGGQAVGLGNGPAVRAFAASLDLEASVAEHLRLFALMWRNSYDSETGAEPLMELVARYATLVPSQNIDAAIEPERLRMEDLDWAFIEFEPVRDERLKGKGFVAKILNYLLSRDGSLSALSDGSAVPISLLQQMVREGKGVVAIAEGIEGAKAIMAEYRLRSQGRAIFNFLVTDEVCASEILRQFNRRSSDIPHRRDWWVKRHAFLSAFLRYNAKQTNNEIAKSLSLSVKQVRRLLEHAAQGNVGVDTLLSFQVRPPSLEMALETALLKNWSLMEARVVPTLGGIEENLRLVGRAGADLLASLLRCQEDFTIGFGGGRAIKAVAEALDLNRLLRNLPLLKRLRICILERNPLPKVLGVTAETILSPLLSSIDDKVTVSRYNGATNEPKLDAVFVGIGSLNYPDSVHAFVHEEGLDAAKDRLAGLILFQFITWDGQVLPTHWARELGFMPLSELQRMVREGKPVVIVAYGAHKADAILAAHKMGLFNCLVVDRVLAEALLALTTCFTVPLSVSNCPQPSGASSGSSSLPFLTQKASGITVSH